ncbi:MAG: hypothetical protein JXA06_03670 [Bacteroidetes bacterium]|nr:hypothetical protein [Bacteroidota bacterium]
MKPIKISTEKISLQAELGDSPTAKLIYETLPIEGDARRWGDEIYFSIPVESRLEEQARAEMTIGEIAYWPPGSAFCIFFGPTPASLNNKPHAAGPVNPVGKITGDAAQLKAVRDGEKIRIESAGDNP